MATQIVAKGSRKSTNPADPSTTDLSSVAVDELMFVGRSSQITVPVLNLAVERQIEGASNLIVTIHDPHRRWLTSDAIRGQSKGKLLSKVVVDKLVFALAGFKLATKGAINTELEEDAVYRMRETRSALTMTRGDVTRAQFIARMCNEAEVPLVCPQLEKVQPTAKRKETHAERDRNRKRGFAKHAKLVIKGQPADHEQIEALEDALIEADDFKASHLAVLAMLVASIGESDCRPSEVDGVTGTHKGFLQSNQIGQYETGKQARAFLEGGESFGAGGAMLLASEGKRSPGQIATEVEVSGEPSSYYDQYLPEAEAILEAWHGGTDYTSSGSNSEQHPVPYQFHRKAKEGSWECARRLAEEVAWYFFIVAGTAYYLTGDELLESRARMLVSPGADGFIDEPQINYGQSPKRTDTITVTCDAGTWEAPPGSKADVEGYGPVDGPWIVTQIGHERARARLTTVTLGRDQKPKPEPAPELTSSKSKSSSNPNAAGYVNPLPAGFAVGRTDMGVDFSGTPGAEILAIGNALIQTIVADWFEGQPLLEYELLDGPHKGRKVYVAEQINVIAQSGQRVPAGTVIARYATSGTAIEMGWAAGGGTTYAQSTTGYTEGEETAAGKSFRSFLAGLGMAV